MEDKIIECQSCKQEFVWTGSEQKFYNDKNLDQPQYCMICRGMHRQAEKDDFRGKKEV